MCNVTHILLAMAHEARYCLSKNVPCHSHPGHRTKCNEIAFQKNVQCHIHPVVHRTRCNEIAFLSQKMSNGSLPVGHGTRCDESAFQKMCNVTHELVIIGWDAFQNVQCHSLSVGHGTRCDHIMFQTNVLCHPLSGGHRARYDQITFQKMSYLTHKLVVRG